MASSDRGSRPGKPSRRETSPRCITPPADNARNSQCHHIVIFHSAAVVAEGDRSGGLERREVGEVLARPPARDAGHRRDLAISDFARPLDDPADALRLVERRIGIRHANNVCEPPGRCGPSARFDGLLVPLPRLAQVHVNVHQPRTNNPPGRINRFRALRRTLHNSPALDRNIRDLIAPDVGVDYASAAKEQCRWSLHDDRL
jgi:hypothetical protein